MYLHDWSQTQLDGIKRDFRLTSDDLEGVTVLLASCCEGDSCGDAFVLFMKNDRLYEVNAFHHSCNCLAGQWQPEETYVSALKYRLLNGELGRGRASGNCFEEELRRLLVHLEN